MSSPYLTQTAGAWLSSEDWNEVQVRALEELAAHGHAPGSLTGESVEPGARVAVASAEVESLRVAGRTLVELIDERIDRTSLAEQLRSALPLSGGQVTGDLEVEGDLHVRGDLRVGGQIFLDGRSLTGSTGDAGSGFKVMELYIDNWQTRPTENTYGSHNMNLELPWAARVLVIARAWIQQIWVKNWSGANVSVQVGEGRLGSDPNYGLYGATYRGSFQFLVWNAYSESEGQGQFSLPAGPVWIQAQCGPNIVEMSFLILAFRETA